MFKKTQTVQPSHSWLTSLERNVPEKRIFKQNQTTENYSRHKLALSVHKACMDAQGYIGEAELTALNVCREVEAWLESKYEVTSGDIKRVASRALRHYNPVAAYEYAPVKENQPQRDDYGFVRL